ncbi:uncharacterized protein LOC135210484 [Macrobrachium nipponense]|uniref:uncharacterized protein LOC135210484 n=1 Tax=Macrobrachium nipponense TaxID=159736 RepID=UPI0030C826ED
MKLLLLGVILFLQTSLSCGKSSKTKNIDFTHGTIVERIEDVFITASNIVIEVDMQAIFLPEDVINLKSDLLRFAVSLNEMHQCHFPVNPESSLAQTLSIAEMLSYDLQNKTAEAEALARDLLMWTVRHNNLERRNPFIFAALNIFGSVASLGLGISNRLKINYQNKRIEFLQHENELVLSERRHQLSSINQIMSLVNEHSSNIDQIMEVQHLLATLAYYSSKIDHIRTKISHFIEKSKDYIEAITLATKAVLSHQLLSIKDLTLTLENGREKLGYVPLLDAHKIEFYYSLISVNVENYRIMITIPFDSSDAWQAYKIAPFPTFMTNNSSPVISNLTGHVLISPDRETYTVIKDLDRFTHCSGALNNKVCATDSFEFHHISMDSCELGIVLNGSLSHSHEGCLKKRPTPRYSLQLMVASGRPQTTRSEELTLSSGNGPISRISRGPVL